MPREDKSPSIRVAGIQKRERELESIVWFAMSIPNYCKLEGYAHTILSLIFALSVLGQSSQRFVALEARGAILFNSIGGARMELAKWRRWWPRGAIDVPPE